MVASVFLNLIYLLFPLCCYFIYLVYSKAVYEKERLIFLDLSLFSSYYFCSRFGDFSFISCFLINIPLLLSIYKRRVFPSIVLLLCTSIFLSNIYNASIVIFITQYVVIFILGFFNKFNINKIFFICNLILGMFLFIFNIIDLKLFGKLFLGWGIMYFLFSVILLFFDKISTIIKMYSSLEEITKEKKLYESLFKITHEIKNPLAVCKGYLDMFDIKNTAKANRYIGIINQEIDRTLLLLKDFSNVSKLNIEKSIIEINMLLEDVCDEAGLILKNNIEFKNEISDEEIYINGDYNRLKQVLINVIKNAKEAINKDGIVELKARPIKNKYLITVKDNGIGMDKETSSKIGTAFFTTKKSGTGLGVCFSKEIIEKHSGTMEYISRFGKGTIVKIALPIHK